MFNTNPVSDSRRSALMLLYTDERMLDHKPVEGHPERPERLAAVLRHLRRTGQFEQLERPAVRPATDDELQTVHDARYIARIAAQVSRGVGQVEADTWLSAGSDLAARLAAGAVVDAVRAVLTGPTRRAACLVRPPGHHARPADPMGFCLYNSVAVGVAGAIERGEVNRVLIVDWDVHHGNGTQEMFYDRADVGFLSIHRHPFYPGSGTKTETGTGPGLGTTRNVPLPFGTHRTDYLSAFRTALEASADRLRPELIVISAGFDAHIEDRVGNLGLENEDFLTMVDVTKRVADVHGQGRIVSVLEGGYNCPILAGCVSEHLDALKENQ